MTLPPQILSFSPEELQPFLLGTGTERSCFIHPTDSHLIIKTSSIPHTKQTKREISYFHFLQKRHIPFTHLPAFKGSVRTSRYLGLIQERIMDYNGKPSVSLKQYIEKNPTTPSFHTALQALLADLLRYLYKYNILVCDLQLSNIFVQVTVSGEKLVLIDGIGTTDLIKVAQYIPYFGKRKIIRKFTYFLMQKPALRALFPFPQEICEWVKNQVKQ